MHLEDLERLARLRDQGILSDDEFEREKARLLSDPKEPEQQSYYEDEPPRRGGRILAGLISLILVGGGAAWFFASGFEQPTVSPPSKGDQTSDWQFTSTLDQMSDERVTTATKRIEASNYIVDAAIRCIGSTKVDYTLALFNAANEAEAIRTDAKGTPFSRCDWIARQRRNMLWSMFSMRT